MSVPRHTATRASIRLMQPDDLPEVAKLDVRAFIDNYKRSGRAYLPSERTDEYLAACLELNPPGCLVATEGERLLGFTFSRVWGNVGWIGVIAVDPAAQGKHVGTMLLDAAVDVLRQARCSTIGLETMPDSGPNIGFYTRCGFTLRAPTLALYKTMEPQSAELTELPPDEAPSEATVSRVSRSSWSALDYAAEAASARRRAWGGVLAWTDPDPWAIAVVRTLARRHVAQASLCDIDAIAVVAAARQRFPDVLRAIEAFAQSRRLSRMRLSINGEQPDAIRQAIAYGFAVGTSALRLTLCDDGSSIGGIDASEWGM